MNIIKLMVSLLVLFTISISFNACANKTEFKLLYQVEPVITNLDVPKEKK